MANDTFKIPKNSFTAFRLTYLPVEEISETSKTTLIGNAPHIYHNDQGPGLVKGTVRKAKHKARRTFDSTLDNLTKQIYREERLTQNKYRLHDLGRFDHIISDIENLYLQDTSDSSDNEDVLVTEMEWDDSLGVHQTGGRTVDQGSTESTPSLPTLDSQSIQIPMILEPTSMVSSIERVGTNYTYAEVESKLSTLRNVKFRGSSRKNSRIEVAHPEPIIDLQVVPDTHSYLDEREHHKLRRRFKEFAKLSTGKAKHRTKDLRYRIFKGIMRTYEVGEIILKEKILVLTKSTLNNTHFTTFEENEPCDTRVQEYWREYVALLRKLDHDSIVLQLYKGNERQEKPDHEHELTSKLTAGFYSLVDKSISLTIPKDNWCLIHILKFHDNMRSVRWLYFIKQVLGDVLDSSFNVFIPELKISLNVIVPESVVLDSIKESSFLKVEKLDSGYNVKHTALIQHLLDSIKQQILESNNPQLLGWLEGTIRPWFCFKHYDRLEWIFDDSEIFFIKNQIFKPKFTLEIRDMTITKRTIPHLTPKAPLPVEGFLSRLTDIGGNEQNMFRTFYKLSYFHTCDNLLFFTQFYRALMPQNLKSVEEEVFEHCSYETNDTSHIAWLDSSDFSQLDKSAFEEFERKAQLVLKADSVIDLNQVIEIRKVPPSELKLAHNLLFHMAWYGEPTKAEEPYLLDSVLELTTLNEGKIRLQAANQRLRDIWYDRLTSIAEYWKIRKQVEIEMIDKIRTQNLEILNIDEFVDSNINQEAEASELQNSVANPFLNTIDHVSLSNSLMISGYLYQKYKKHSDFNQYFVALSSGNLILYSLYKRSKITGEWKRSSYYRHHLTIPLYDCYLYSGNQTSLDLLNRQKETDSTDPGNKSLPRIYGDGWKSREEESMRCFTLWFGRKRSITKKNDINLEPKNPNLLKMIKKLGITGRSVVFMARSRQERELWVSRIYTEINRSSVLYNA